MEEFKNSELNKFIPLSSNLNLFQGSGGNFSFKVNNKIYVTPSGYSVNKCIKESTFLDFEIKNIKNLVLSKKELMQKNEKYRPSIETYFHALISNKYVFHFHPVNLLPDLCKKGFSYNQNPLFTYIDYFKPGLEISMEINSQRDLNSIILLKNHGVIISGESFDEIEQDLNLLFNHFDKPVDEKFKIVSNLYTRKLKNSLTFYKEKIRNNVFFTPDQSVFLNNIDIKNYFESKNVISFGLEKNIDLNLFTYIELLESIEIEDIDPISTLEINKLINWESEEYRLGIKND